jgi:hypothetical protein
LGVAFGRAGIWVRISDSSNKYLYLNEHYFFVK